MFLYFVFILFIYLLVVQEQNHGDARMWKKFMTLHSLTVRKPKMMKACTYSSAFVFLSSPTFLPTTEGLPVSNNTGNTGMLRGLSPIFCQVNNLTLAITINNLQISLITDYSQMSSQAKVVYWNIKKTCSWVTGTEGRLAILNLWNLFGSLNCDFFFFYNCCYQDLIA